MEDCWCDNLIRVTLLLICYFVSSGTDDSQSCRRAPFLEKISFFSFLENDKSTNNGLCPMEAPRLSRSSHCLSYVHNFHSSPLADECMITSAKSLTTNKEENKSKAIEVKGQPKKPSGLVKKLKGSKRQRKKNKKKKLGKKKKRS